MWRLSLNIEFGRDEPERDFSQTDSVVSIGPDPERPPIGFCPPSDPTRHPDDER